MKTYRDNQGCKVNAQFINGTVKYKMILPMGTVFNGELSEEGFNAWLMKKGFKDVEVLEAERAAAIEAYRKKKEAEEAERAAAHAAFLAQFKAMYARRLAA